MTFGTRSFYSPLRVRTLWAAAWGTSLMFSMAAPDARAAGVIAECSESQLVAAVHGGGAVQFACSGTVVVTSTLHIRSNTSISGAGFIVTLSGGGSVPVLQVEAKTTLTLSSLTIASGYNQTGGGGVDNTGTLNIPHSTFSSNSGAQGQGGAINNNGSLRITNSTFTSNTANGGAGGAIYNTSTGTVAIQNSTFLNNQAGQGGAIYNSPGRGFLLITNSTFASHEATSFGGAINNAGSLTLTSSTLYSNSASNGGGLASTARPPW
jgi:hypothetical protein